MKVFEKLQSMSIDEYAEWFETNCLHNDDPCIKWFNRTYCENCESVVKDGHEFAYCELNNMKCRHFKDMDEVPDNKQTIKLWLESECD